MIRAWAASAALLLGCTSGGEPVRGARVGFEQTPVQPQPAAPEEPAWPREHETPDPPAPLPIQVEAAEEEPERDLGAELRAALGTPSDCVSDFVASKATTIRINVSGVVRPTGMIIEPAAYGSGLSSTALDCVRQRVGTVVLKPLDETVSSTASTVVEIKYEPPVIVESSARRHRGFPRASTRAASRRSTRGTAGRRSRPRRGHDPRASQSDASYATR